MPAVNSLISVVVPVYNVEKYLRESVESILAQTYKELEIILVDDGSADESGKICDEYASADNRITVIHKENGGLSDARNTGLKNSHGKYIYFLDSDDFLRADALEKLVCFAERLHLQIVFFDGTNIYEIEENEHRRDKFERLCDHGVGSGPAMLLRLDNYNEYASCVPMLFLRSDYIAENKLHFYKGIMHEDELFTAAAFVKAGRVGHLHEPLYIRRVREGSIMTGKNYTRSFKGFYVCTVELIRILDSYREMCPGKRALYEKTAEIANCALIMYAMLTGKERKEHRKYYDALRRQIIKHDYFRSRKLKLKLPFFGLYIKYMSIKCAVKGMIRSLSCKKAKASDKKT